MLYPKMNRARTVMDLSACGNLSLEIMRRRGITVSVLQEGNGLLSLHPIMIRRMIRLIRITMDGPGMKERSRFLPFLRGRGCFCVLMP